MFHSVVLNNKYSCNKFKNILLIFHANFKHSIFSNNENKHIHNVSKINSIFYENKNKILKGYTNKNISYSKIHNSNEQSNTIFDTVQNEIHNNEISIEELSYENKTAINQCISNTQESDKTEKQNKLNEPTNVIKESINPKEKDNETLIWNNKSDESNVTEQNKYTKQTDHDNKNVSIEEAIEIDKDIRKSLIEVFKYKHFTDVQKIIYENVIKEKKKNDLLIQAKTGTGKTISYLLLVIDDIIKNRIMSVHTLIIVPTRELANQIYNEAKLLLTFKNNINVLTLIGGVKRREDQINIRRVKPDIIICTVGRLLDHFECTYLFNTLFENLKMLIIDEADQLLSHGYQNDIDRILTYLPQKKRNILLSATLCHNINEIRKKMCKPGDRKSVV